MNTISIIILALLFSGIFFCLYLFYRNQKTYNLRMKASDLSFKYNMRHFDKTDSAFDWFYGTLPGYTDMLYDFRRPLTLEGYFTKDQLEKIYQ